LVSAGSAQAAIFDFDVLWKDGTTTKGWLDVDDTKSSKTTYGGTNAFNLQSWSLTSLLNADFTHEGTRYGKSNLTSFRLENYNFLESSVHLPTYGNVANSMKLRFNNQEFTLNDIGADGSSHANSDSGHKYSKDESYGSATSVSFVERSAKAVPEPTTMAGLALVGLGIAATRRKQTKASVKV
jgi:hypothetical protein